MARGSVSTSAGDAVRLGYLRPKDVVLSHPDRLITDARSLAQAAEPQPLPQWKSMEGPLAGMVDQALNEARTKGDFTAHDITIGQALKEVFKRPTSFEDALRIEREVFIDLMKEGLSIARIKHMLETGKPLRN